jgi:uncharacterized SAM-binding protein YcdF (DUF218 family)
MLKSPQLRVEPIMSSHMEVRKMFARLWSLLRLLIVWRLSDKKPDEVASNLPDCIIMLAFGQRVIGNPPDDMILPGPANEAIAIVMRLSSRRLTYHKSKPLPPVLAQWEFAETQAFKGRPHSDFRIAQTFGRPGVYRNTREILEEAQQHMNEHGWKKAVIVAHPWHLVRCIWTAQKIGIEVVNDFHMVQDLNYHADVWNDHVDVPDNQQQTTSLRRWLWYEFRARGYFWLKGWI